MLLRVSLQLLESGVGGDASDKAMDCQRGSCVELLVLQQWKFWFIEDVDRAVTGNQLGNGALWLSYLQHKFFDTASVNLPSPDMPTVTESLV